MHYEILVEGQCELTALSIIMSNILGEYGDRNTWKIHKHQGVGAIPANIERVNPNDRSLLGQLPAKIRAYDKVDDSNRVIIVLVDLDNRDQDEILTDLEALIPNDSDFNIRFCFAVEELEAWFLADKNSILAAYPNANENIHSSYVQDSICGTWEVLARVLNSNIGSLPKRDRIVLREKCTWAKKISPHMNIEQNLSSSFKTFKSNLLEFAA